MLLLHGSTSSSATWWQVGPELARRGWTVVALDLPSHGSSPAAHAPLVPSLAARAVAEAVTGQRFDLVVGHSFGAAVAVALLGDRSSITERVVLEELPGPRSVDWRAEAMAVRAGAEAARREPVSAVAQTRLRQPRWAPQDAQHAAADLAACRDVDVAAGLRSGSTWTPPDALSRLRVPATLLLAPDAPGVDHGEDTSALRGADRADAVTRLRAGVRVVDAGHCIHRDDPASWLACVASAAGPQDEPVHG